MAHQVILSPGATEDMYEIAEYVSVHDAPEKALRLLANIEEVIASLADFPHRGTRPPELAELGDHNYREVRFTRYRIVYWVGDASVQVLVVADGRRDFQSLLQRRLG